jgi:plasmid stability protein
MPVSLSIKNVPDDLAEKLRVRAAKNHRSMQGELLAILEEGLTQGKPLTPSELHWRLKSVGFKTPEESVQFVREDRDAGHRR